MLWRVTPVRQSVHVHTNHFYWCMSRLPALTLRIQSLFILVNSLVNQQNYCNDAWKIRISYFIFQNHQAWASELQYVTSEVKKKKFMYQKLLRNQNNRIQIEIHNVQCNSFLHYRSSECVHSCTHNVHNLSWFRPKGWSAHQISSVEPYDFHDAKNMAGIAESSHKNGIYCITRNVTEFVKFWMN